jgi:hypothetical protein
MYCSHCHRQLFYKDLTNRGWCDTCRDIVCVSQCKVSYWFVAAVLTALVPLGV